jgi:hypothetical protein
MNRSGYDSTSRQDEPVGTDKKHPILFYWLTAGAATVIAAVIGVSVATSSSHSSTSSQNSAQQNSVESSSGVPAAFQGSWAGIVTYPTVGAQAEVTLALNAGQVGGEVGQWANVNLNCSGTATLEGGGNTLSLHMVTTENNSGVCVSQWDAQVSQSGSDIALVVESDFGAAPGSGTLSPAG